MTDSTSCLLQTDLHLCVLMRAVWTQHPDDCNYVHLLKYWYKCEVLVLYSSIFCFYSTTSEGNILLFTTFIWQRVKLEYLYTVLVLLLRSILTPPRSFSREIRLVHSRFGPSFVRLARLLVVFALFFFLAFFVSVLIRSFLLDSSSRSDTWSLRFLTPRNVLNATRREAAGGGRSLMMETHYFYRETLSVFSVSL